MEKEVVTVNIVIYTLMLLTGAIISGAIWGEINGGGWKRGIIVSIITGVILSVIMWLKGSIVFL